MSYEVVLSPRARRALSEELPASAAAACFEFISGQLTENPRRVGKPLRNELTGYYAVRRGEFRIIYNIDDHRVRVEVISIRHRRDAYRS